LLDPFQLPFVQRGLIEVLILAVPAGLLGTWIVLRGLAFFSHAVGTAAFPGLVLADGLGFAAPLGAFGAALAFTVGASALRGRRTGQDAVVALVLVGCLAGGVILASDVFGSGSNIETLLFGSLLLVDGGDLALAGAAAAATLLASVLIGQHWLRIGFDPTLTDASGPKPQVFDAVLLALLALASTAALTVVGALLVTALFLVPAVTARLLTDRLLRWQLLSVGLVALEGTVGLWLSVKTDAPPGATIACVAGGVFVVVAAARALGNLPRAATAAAALTALALLAAGCGGGSGDGGSEKLDVVATTTQLGDFVRNVGGEAVDVDQILQPNTDPHNYEPGPPTSRTRPARSWSSPAATTSMPGSIRSSPTAAATRKRSTSAPSSRSNCPASPRARRRRGMTPTGGTTPATPRPPFARSRGSWRPPTPPTRRSSSATPTPTWPS
jgi:manganese/iron transport system permease protein